MTGEQWLKAVEMISLSCGIVGGVWAMVWLLVKTFRISVEADRDRP